MKLIFIYSHLLFLLPAAGLAQDTSEVKTYNNEIGINLEGITTSIFSKGSSQYTSSFSYSNRSQYDIFLYRRHLKKSNIRFSIGGYTNTENYSDFPDTLLFRYQQKNWNLSACVGYERCLELSKRWQFFYGIDFINYRSYTNSYSKDNSGWWKSTSVSYVSYGGGPAGGIRFKVNKRISLLTETSLLFVASANRYKYTYPEQYTSNNIKPVDSENSNTAFFTAYSAPVSLVFAFDF